MNHSSYYVSKYIYINNLKFCNRRFNPHRIIFNDNFNNNFKKVSCIVTGNFFKIIINIESDSIKIEMSVTKF